MPLSINKNKYDLNKKSVIDPNKVRFFALFIGAALLAVLLYNSSTPVLAADKASASTSNVSLFDKFSSFVKAPFVQVALAQTNQKVTAPKPVQQEGILQKIWNFITAPYKTLLGSPSTPAPKRTVQATPTPAPAATPVPGVSSQGSTTGLNVVKTTAVTPTASSIVTALSAGTTYIDLIGKTVIDSNGNIYPSGTALAQTDKPTLGTTTNKYYGLNLYQFSVDKAGGITTVLGGGIVKSSSKGVLSSSAVDVNSGDITGTLQAGNGGTGNTAYAIGDILYSATVNTLSKLAIGSSNQILTVASGIPSWSSTLSLTTVSVGDGSAATPGLNFANDTDSGLWRIGGNSIALTTGGSAFSGISINAAGNVGIGATGAGGSLVVASGNVGIGTTIPNATLSVQGNVGIGYTGSSQVIPTNGLAVFGNVGVGITTANSALTVNGGVTVGSRNITAPTNGMFVLGNVGLGITTPGTGLAISSNAIIGFSGTNVPAPSSGLAVSGNVGIGVTTANSVLAVAGNGVFGAGYAGMSATTNGLLIEGSVGIGISVPSQTFQIGTAGNSLVFTSGGNLGVGVTTPLNTLDIIGSAQIRTAGAASLAVTSSNRVGVGTTAPGATFSVNGATTLGTFSSTTGPSNGLAVSGNVGIGVTTANNALQVLGAGLFSGTWGGAVVPTNGLVVEGNVGIGISVPSQLFQVGTAGSALAFTSGGNLGVGVTTPINTLDIIGSAQIRTSGAASFAVTSSNRVGVGTTAPGGTFSVSGNTTLGTFSNTSGPANGLAVSGNVGIGITTANSNLVVVGNAAIGSGFGSMLAPTNGLLVEGNVGIGTSQPGTARLSVSGGNVGLGVTSPRAQLEVVGNGNLAALFMSGNVGIGASAPGTLLTVGDTLGSQFLVASNGNVGIGVTSNSPLAALHVSGTTFLNGNVGIGTSASGGYLLTVGGGAAAQFRVDSNGNVGIGTTFGGGSYKLDVGGKVRATGFNGICSAAASPDCNQDVAEIYTSLENVESGDVLVIDSGSNRTVRKSRGAYEPSLIGAVSTTPGLLLGIGGANIALGGEANEYQASADPMKPAVALSGKIPVKVTGAVKSGDYLTSSSIPGVAMKATKAGPVIGQALEDYNGEGVGKVLTFARLGYFNGTSISDLISKDAITAITSNYSQLVLESLLAEQKAVLQAASASELLTDRIAAGVEIITPKLTADNVVAGLIKPLEGKNLTLALNKDQGFNITNGATNETVISFDNDGNAYFKGRVVAASVKADQIEGLRVLADAIVTSKISSLVDQKVSEATSGAKAVAGVSTQAPTLDANILVRLNADGGLSVGGPAEFKSQSVFSAVSEFLSSVIFRGDVSIISRIFLPKDSVGQATIKAGSDSVPVSFARGYDSAPSVNVTQTAGSNIDWDVRFVVQGLSGSGFTIKLNKAAPADMIFSWTAFSQSNSFTSTQPAQTPVAPAPSATPAPSASPTPAPSATPAPVPSATPVPAETPAPTATPTATPAPSASPTPAPSATPTI